MRFFTAILAFPLFLSLSNCNKTPRADFAIHGISKHPHFGEVIFVGEPLFIVNKCIDAKQYKWEFPDGTVSYKKYPSYINSHHPKFTDRTITLTVSNGRGEKSHSVKRSYRAYIPYQDGESFSIDTLIRTPYLKGIYDLKDGRFSFRFSEGSNSRELEGRILFHGQFPTPGEYSINDKYVSVEVTTSGYNGYMPYQSQPDWGGTITIRQTSDDRLRITYNQIRVYSNYHKKEILVSGDLIY